MKNEKLSCLVWLAVWIAVSCIAGWLVYRRIPEAGPAFWGGLIGGLLLLMPIGWLSAIPKRVFDLLLIVRSKLGSEPRDGRRTAITGPLYASGELVSPLSRERCVAYSYEIKVLAGQTSFEGFAMSPLTIEHNAERIRILGIPEIDFKPSTSTSPRNAMEYIERTEFSPVKPEHATTKYDVRRPGAEADFSGSLMIEKIVPPGETVTVTGVYSTEKKALTPPIRIMRGSGSPIASAWKIIDATLAALFFALLPITALVLLYANVPLDSAEQRTPHRRFFWPEVEAERLIHSKVRVPLAEMGFFGTPGMYFVPMCEGCVDGVLEIDGRTYPLRSVQSRPGREFHLSTLPPSAHGVTLLPKDQVLLTVNGRTAPVPPSWIQPMDVQSVLDNNGKFEGRITIIAPDRSIRCRVRFSARAK